MQVVMPLPEFWAKYRHDSVYRTPLFRNPEDPVEVLSNMIFYSKNKIKKTRLHPKKSNLRNYKHGFLSQHDVDAILEEYKIPNVSSLLVNPEELKNTPGLSFPVCLKGISESVIHKSELNAVRLNIGSYEELHNSANEIEHGFHSAGFSVENFLIQPFIKAKYEFLMGGFRDLSFGPMIMFGSGGKYVEIFNDTLMKFAYLSEEDVNDFINKTKAGSIITGVRGDKGIDINIVKSMIKNSAQMMLDNKNILEFDLNPVILTYDDRFFTVDARIKWG
jgi:hypothetical protein